MRSRRVLVVAPWLPAADRESGLRRIADLVDMFVDRGWRVTFGCIYPPEHDQDHYVRELELKGVETHAPLAGLDELPDDAEFELAILAFWYVAETFLPQLREASPSTRVVVDSVDLHFLREIRQNLRGELGDAPAQLARRQGNRLVREVNPYAAADAVLTVSEKEAGIINDLAGRSDLAFAVPDTEELPRSRVRTRDRQGIIFLGNFLHTPNRDAVAYLCEEIVPRIDPDLLAADEISIVGTAAEEYAREPSAGLPHVKTVGWVPSVLPYLESARISVVPLRYGAGTKRKVIQALMVGTPTVTTSCGAEGLGVSDGRELLIADDPDRFAAAIERLLQHPLARWRMARRGRKHVLGLHGKATVGASFDRVLATVLERPPRKPAEHPDGEETIVGVDGIARSSAYVDLVVRVRDAVESEVPEGAQVLVATRGDDALLELRGRRGVHFPCADDGRYAGHYPADSEAAIAHLEELRSSGATHLLLPSTAFWWLDHYEGLRDHLETTYKTISSGEHVTLFDLTSADLEEQATTARSAAQPAEITPKLVDDLRPRALRAAERYRNGARSRRVLVLGVYLAGTLNTAKHVISTLAATEDLEVVQRWIALGGDPPDAELRATTALTVTEPTPKYQLLNRLLAEEDLESYDYVVTTDDDIVVPDLFLDLFIGIQAGLELDLAQPARTPNSHVDHPIVIQQRGVLARKTLFVEIGPLASFGRPIYDLVFPFDESNPMGWGFENVWSRLLEDEGRSEGIVDAVPVDHSIRKPVTNYVWAEAVADRERYLNRNPHRPLEECFRVLDVVGVQE